MSRIERMYCVISTSYLAVLFDVFLFKQYSSFNPVQRFPTQKFIFKSVKGAFSKMVDAGKIEMPPSLFSTLTTKRKF